MNVERDDLSKKVFLESRGWATFYHPDYWVHKKTVRDPVRQDYTHYGMNLQEAYEFETEHKRPFDIGLPIL